MALKCPFLRAWIPLVSCCLEPHSSTSWRNIDWSQSNNGGCRSLTVTVGASVSDPLAGARFLSASVAFLWSSCQNSKVNVKSLGGFHIRVREEVVTQNAPLKACTLKNKVMRVHSDKVIL